MKSCLTALLVFTTMNIFAQQHKVHLAIGYSPAMPIGSEVTDYVSKNSFRGLQAAVLYNIRPDWKIGLQVGYNDFYEKFPRGVYKTASGADVSAVLTNTMQYIPALIKGEYRFAKNSWLHPWIGAGAGVGFINYEQFVGAYLYKQFYTKAAFAGDFGVEIPLKKNSDYAFRLSTAYTFSPLNKEGISSIATWGVQAAVVFPLK